MIKFFKALWAWLTSPSIDLSSTEELVKKTRAKKRNLRQSGYTTLVDTLPPGGRGIVNVPVGIDAKSIRNVTLARARKLWGSEKAVVEMVTPTMIQVTRLP